MRTDKILVNSRGRRMESALREVEKVAAYKELSPKGALHLRLLTEEMMGMMRSITGEQEGTFWIEEEEGVYQLHLVADTRLTSAKREQLLSASTSGKNESAKTLMGWVRDLFDRSADEDVAMFTSPLMMGTMMEHSSSLPTLDWEWSMTEYQDNLSALVAQKNEEAQEIWDELEKSVVTRVADEVKVSIRGHRAELVIIKKIA